ncbi:MAG: potassium transporter Kup [Candidatus Latescibacteria bacterium]|nr:potassium transporter Kup [Candidatus Latescibacterota bacterium]
MTRPDHQTENADGIHHQPLPLLVLGALGVVYGDIGTSPLYALRECFVGVHGVPPTEANVLGLLSLICWSLMMVITVKYLVFVLRADNGGEGGILALMALVTSGQPKRRWVLVGLGVFGASLLYADGMLTPAISVLSAVEGLSIATPLFQPYILPAAVAIMVALFFLQHYGTGKIGVVFGPIVIVWFAAIGALGAASIFQHPGVLRALDPLYGLEFLFKEGWRGFAVLGAVFLVATGGEALYADMGHFGRRAIQWGWFCAALPCLLLNYFGQGALVLRDPAAVANPFYLLVPGWGLIPMVILATLATVIASQAVISGAFSLTRQAIQLGYCPRLEIRQTSTREIGQVYLPSINWMLMLGTILLMLAFRESGNLAAAYGIAVSTTMFFTTLFLYSTARQIWSWRPAAALAIAGFFVIPDLGFFAANLLKVHDGGWLPLLMASGIYLLMSTWEQGRRYLRSRIQEMLLPVDLFLQEAADHAPLRVPGIAVFLSNNPTGIPITLLHNYKHNKVLHQTIVLLTVQTAAVPYLEPEERAEMQCLGEGFYRLILRYGFCEMPDVSAALAAIHPEAFTFAPMDATFFLGREVLVVRRHSPWPAWHWRRRLFAFLSHNAWDATRFFSLPPNRVVVLGLQLEV